MVTKALQDPQAMQVYVLDIARQAGLRSRPPILIREVTLDGGDGPDPGVSEYLVTMATKDGSIDTRIPRGDAKDPEWRFLTRARVEDAVALLASRLN